MIRNGSSIDKFLNEINTKVRLSDYIGQYVNLTEKGNSYVGKCPFHNENTPSFNVNNDKSLFYCFGCKTGGNIINFTTKYKNLPFLEAVQFLSQYSGIPFKHNNKRDHSSAEEKLIIKINNESNFFFQKELFNNKYAYQYIKSRGVSEGVIKMFQLGFCPDEKLLVNYLKSKGFELEQIKKADLLIKNKKNEYFGRFSHRITFPIYNITNDLVGFGGRAVKPSKIKYINSQENLVFKKSQILFGLNQNSDYIRSNKEIFLVEGYMDVIKLFSSDIKTAVSPLGTTLSEFQLKKMWSYCDIPFICFDGDLAGRNAADKVAVKILKFLIPAKSVKFIRFPENSDPDSFMENKDKEDFMKLKFESEDLSDVIWGIIENSIESDAPEFLAGIDSKIKQMLDNIEDSRVSKEYFKFLNLKKDNFIWNSNKQKSYTLRKPIAEKVIDNINEKIFILMILIDHNYFYEYQEEIFKIKLSDKNLESEKSRILDSFSNENLKTQQSIEKYKENNPSFYFEMNELRKIHLSGLDKDQRNLLFKQIMNNLRLPLLIEERKVIQKEIIRTKENVISETLLKRYN